MQTKRIPNILLIALVLIASFAYWFDYISEHRNVAHDDCLEKNLHDFYGEEYIVTECLLGPSAWDSEISHVRLGVYSKDRALLAERFF